MKDQSLHVARRAGFLLGAPASGADADAGVDGGLVKFTPANLGRSNPARKSGADRAPLLPAPGA